MHDNGADKNTGQRLGGHPDRRSLDGFLVQSDPVKLVTEGQGLAPVPVSGERWALPTSSVRKSAVVPRLKPRRKVWSVKRSPFLALGVRGRNGVTTGTHTVV